MVQKRAEQTLWKKLSFKKIPICEVCQQEPAFSFSFFSDPLEEARIEELSRQHPPPASKPLTGEELKKFIDGPRELAEAKGVEDDPYIPKLVCRLAGNCSRHSERYYVTFDKFFESPTETIDWLAHLWHKGWVNWDSFLGAMDRLKKMIT